VPGGGGADGAPSSTREREAGFIGRPLPRREDARLLRGAGRFVDEIEPAGVLHAAIVRSPHAHAEIRSVDLGPALFHPEVEAAFAGNDLGDLAAPAPMAWKPSEIEVLTPDWWPLARERVACVGTAVAVVLARDPYSAEDAAEEVIVDYEPLAAIADPLEALRLDAPLVHPELGSNRCFSFSLGGGDLQAAFERADVVVEREIRNHRVAGVPMEPRGVVAEAAGGRVTVWTSTQNPHLVRTYLARQLGIAEDRLRIVCPDVGGGFGIKANVYVEEVLVAWCARRLGRPVKWIESRRENLISSNHGRDQVDRVRIAARADGEITGLEVEVIADLGAYQMLFTPSIPTTTATVACGCYAIPAVHTEVVGVFTNKFPTDAVRGAGRPEATHLIEVMIDQLAAELDLDRLELRRRNFFPAEAFPATAAIGVVYDSGDYQRSLDRLLEHVDRELFEREQAELRKRGVLRGIGFSTFMEASGLAPSWATGPGGNGLEMTFWEAAAVRVAPDGSVTVQTGVCHNGQGHETTFAQVVADRVGAPVDRVSLIWGDTDAVPAGMGTYGSRSIAVGAEAAALAADRVAAKARKIAGAILGASPGEVELDRGVYALSSDADRALSLEQIAAAAHHPGGPTAGFEPGLEASCFFDPPGFVHPFGAHAAIVEVDPETGRIEIVRYVAVDDCGRIINPILVEGQIHGGVAHAIGQALYERIEFDAAGQPLTTSLLDYTLPGAPDLPWLETDHTETPSPINSLGAKGAGEAGTIAATPAILNATLDALRPLGVEFLNMPLTAEAVVRAVRDAERRRGSQPARSGAPNRLGTSP
jgi:carbon-monoxide dehydrogenase large subunit